MAFEKHTEDEGVDFASFLAAVREFESDRTEVRTTAHSSSVRTTDWEQVQDLLAARR